MEKITSLAFLALDSPLMGDAVCEGMEIFVLPINPIFHTPSI